MDNVKLIAQYLEKGSKGEQTDLVGIELEHFVLKKDTHENIGFYGKNGVGEILNRMSAHFEKEFYSEGILIALANEKYSITLEPSSQLEISLAPVENISDAEKIYSDFHKLTDPMLAEYGYELVCSGYREKGRADELELIPKKRYEFMNEYFENTGKCGKNMMRATASAQISIDYADEKDCAKKFRVANILSPVFSLICDNSPYFEGEIYDGRMARTHVWNNVDSDRCGIVPFGDSFSFEEYARYIYERPAILVLNGGEAVFTGNMPISEIYRDKEINEEEIEHIFSMFFPDVRLKRYIEIRPADSMPIDYTLSYAALVKGIFKDCDKFDFYNITSSDVVAAKESIVKYGFDAVIYGKKAYEICDMMLDTALNNLNDGDRKYIAPLEAIKRERKTLKERN